MSMNLFSVLHRSSDLVLGLLRCKSSCQFSCPLLGLWARFSVLHPMAYPLLQNPVLEIGDVAMSGSLPCHGVVLVAHPLFCRLSSLLTQDSISLRVTEVVLKIAMSKSKSLRAQLLCIAN